MEVKRISIDTSKHTFTIHGVDLQERPILQRDIKRTQLEPFFAKLEPTEVALEACAGSHHWGRLLSRLGHRVKLIPPQYVKPFVKRSKNDRTDAEAIGEAASRPTMRTVPLKTVAEQAATIVVKHREMLVAQRTQAINALRGTRRNSAQLPPKVARTSQPFSQFLPRMRSFLTPRGRCSSRWVSMSPISTAKSRHWTGSFSTSIRSIRSVAALLRSPASGRSPRSPWR